jgi:hypothetical protein
MGQPALINLNDKFSLFSDYWRPKVVATRNTGNIADDTFTAPSGVPI